MLDHELLILVFEPYSVSRLTDDSITLKIPFVELIGKWQAGNVLEKHLLITFFVHGIEITGLAMKTCLVAYKF